MAINKWWAVDSKEIYWLESTDRTDLGANLIAPQFDDTGIDSGAEVDTRDGNGSTPLRRAAFTTPSTWPAC